MTNAAWPITEFVARLLEPAEREAVLGDLIESRETGWKALNGVLGLVILRQILLLRTARSWLAGFGVVLPACYLLMGVSASISCTYERLHRPEVVSQHWPTAHEGVLLLLCHVLLLIVWSWAAGYVCASLFRRTLLFSAVLPLALFFFDDFHIAPLPKTCLLLFVLPLILGIFHGRQGMRIAPVVALFLAISMTGLMTFCWSNGALWIFNWALLIPVLCMVAMALMSAGQPAAGVHA